MGLDQRYQHAKEQSSGVQSGERRRYIVTALNRLLVLDDTGEKRAKEYEMSKGQTSRYTVKLRKSAVVSFWRFECQAPDITEELLGLLRSSDQKASKCTGPAIGSGLMI